MNIYLSGIGGVGIGPLAEIAHQAGYKIFGSDQKNSPLTNKLIELGVEVSIGEQNGEFLQKKYQQNGIDWFVHTSALPDNHPELVLAKKLGIKTSKRDELINKILKDKNLKLLAIAGTHGKTTTTGMAIWVAQQLKQPVSWLIGTTLSYGESGYFDPKSQLFIYECDEFDRNFLNFTPEFSVITNIDYDHPDTYPTEESYFEAFYQFMRQSQHTFMWQNDFKGGEKVITGSNAIVRLVNKDKFSKLIEMLPIAGKHNRENAFLLIRAFMEMGWDEESIFNALSSFPGTNRRFEKIADGIYSDYAHHPSEIKATLQMAKEIAKKDGYNGVAVIYQPHQNIRQVELKDNYTPDIFEDTDKIIWLPTFLSRENPNLEILSPEYLSRQLNPDKIHISQLDEKLTPKIKELKNKNLLILGMSAGSLDSWMRENLI